MCAVTQRGTSGSGLCTATAVAGFVRYAAAVATRYIHVAVFELWNEPNPRHPTRHSMPAARYSALLAAVGQAFRQSAMLNSTVLVAGAVAGVDAEYIANLSGALGYASAVSIHPYTGASGGPEIFRDPVRP